jgi:WXXGXW repeat (2 copies)
MWTPFLAAMLRRTRRLLIAVFILCVPAIGSGATFVSVTLAPPLLPVYVQPPIPGPGYLWTPGYWAYGPAGYYWVPGTWVLPPFVGALWTPGYWGWANGAYLWNGGYWGPRVGFYGGVNYGFGYVGVGYAGGYWRGGDFYYNRAVNNVNIVSVHNTYNTVVNNATTTRVSYNGGPRGVRAEPTAVEREAINDRHITATQIQTQHEQAAAGNRALLASENHGRPSVAATPQPAVFDHPGVVSARGNPVRNRAQVQGDSQVARAQGAHPQASAQAAPPVTGTHTQGTAQMHPQVRAQGTAAGHPQGPRNGGETQGDGQHRQ